MIINGANQAGSYQLGDRFVARMGYGAMQLAGPHAFGPSKDGSAAIAVLRHAVESGVTHLDTSDFYGPHVTNLLIREALHPYREDLVIVTKVGGKRGFDGSWHPAGSPAEIESAVYDNLRNLKPDVLDVVNLRVFIDIGLKEGSIAESLTALAELQQRGLIRHIGLSNVTATRVAHQLGATPIQVALAWLLQRAPNILLIPGTSSILHLKANIARACLKTLEA